MNRTVLEDNEWVKILDFLRSCPEVYSSSEAKCRRFVNGVLWGMRSGSQWRLLPDRYGRWNSVYKRFARWCDKGIWERLFSGVADDPDTEAVTLDSTIIRVRQGRRKHAVGKPPKRWDAAVAGSPLKFMSASMHWAIPCVYA